MFALAVFLLLYSIVNPASPARKEPNSYGGHTKPEPPALPQTGATGKSLDIPQTGAIEKPSIGPYQHRFRDLRLQLEVIKLLILRTGKTVPAETMRSISTDMEQLGTLLDHLPGNHPISDRHAAVLARQLDNVKSHLDALEQKLEL